MSLWNRHFCSPVFLPVSASDCKVGNGETYRGPTSITILGVTCQAWSAQSPHVHSSFTPQSHPTKGLEGNVSCCDLGILKLCELIFSLTVFHHDCLWICDFPFVPSHQSCRNPDGDVNGPWCYTTDRNKKWDYCQIPDCGECTLPAFRVL